jgi:hypothetical protein
MGELNFIAGHYAKLDGVPAILTKAEFFGAGSALRYDLGFSDVLFQEPVSTTHQVWGGLFRNVGSRNFDCRMSFPLFRDMR